METVRIDKFLWSVRIFKTRAIAADECDKRHVLVNGTEAKPSRSVRAGDRLAIKKLPYIFTYDIIQLIDKRQPAALVKNYITDTTPQEELDKIEISKMTVFAQRDRCAGRPTKKERREITREFGDL
jgi:ribosome-associated heat shock protein Hsp15